MPISRYEGRTKAANTNEMYKDYFKQKKLIRKENLIEIPFEEFRSSSLKHVKKIYQKFKLIIKKT